MNDKIKAIAEKRKEVLLLAETLGKAKDELNNSELAQIVNELVAGVKDKRESLAVLEDEYKGECVTQYSTANTNEDRPIYFPGGRIKIFTELVFDVEEATGHVVEKKLDNLLRLDLTKFKKYAKAVEPDFVTFKKIPKMTLASDLSEFEE